MPLARTLPAPTGRAAVGIALLGLALLLAWLFHESLFFGKGLVPADALLVAPPWAGPHAHQARNYLLIDQFAFFLPVREFVYQRILQGEFPLWNPHLASGLPTLASMQLGLLYPINLVLLPLGPFAASGIAAFLKLLLAAATTVLYMRRIGASVPAATLSAIAFALSGFMIVWLGHPHVNSAVLLPLMLFLIEGQLRSGPRLRGWAALALVYAAVLFGGHPPTVVHLTLALAAYTLLRLATSDTPGRARFALALVLTLGAGAVAASAQILPFLEYYAHSSLPLSSPILARWANRLPAVELINYLVPLIGGSPAAGFEELRGVFGLGPEPNFNERTGYVGVLTLFLAAAALLLRRCRLSAIHGALAALSLLVALGVPPLPSIQGALPVTDSINPMRMLLVAGWSLAVLAGLGLDHIAGMTPRDRAHRLAACFGLLAAALLAALWLVLGEGLRHMVPGELRGFALRQLLMLAGGLCIALATCLQRIPRQAIAAICIAWTAFDLSRFAYGYNPSIDASEYFPSAPSIEFLRREPQPSRVLGMGMALPANTAAAYGLDDARGVDFMVLRRYEELVSGKAGDFTFYRGVTELPAPFRLLNVRHVLLPAPMPQVPEGFDLVHRGDLAIYRFRHASPRALVVSAHEVVADDREMLLRLRSMSFDPAHTLLLEQEPGPPGAPAAAPGTGRSSAHIARYDPERVEIEVESPQEAFLLLLDNHFPGWVATVDGRPAPILRADYSFRAVRVPQGRSRVEFRYRPASFRLGAALSTVSILALLTLLLRGTARARRAHGIQGGAARDGAPNTAPSAAW